MFLLIRGETRPIYWRVTLESGLHVSGTFDDLKTLRGATKRLYRKYPDWREIETHFDREIV